MEKVIDTTKNYFSSVSKAVEEKNWLNVFALLLPAIIAVLVIHFMKIKMWKPARASYRKARTNYRSYRARRQTRRRR